MKTQDQISGDGFDAVATVFGETKHRGIHLLTKQCEESAV